MEVNVGVQERITTVISTKGQVILPKAIRDLRHWAAGTRLTVENTPDGVLLKATPAFPETRIDAVFGTLRHSGPASGVLVSSFMAPASTALAALVNSRQFAKPRLPRRFWQARARSSVVEHTLHTGGVAGSIPAAPTINALEIKGIYGWTHFHSACLDAV